jgi:hypothetical protein
VKNKIVGRPLRKKRVKRSKVKREVRQKNESDGEVAEQLRLGRQFMAKYRETFAALAKT